MSSSLTSRTDAAELCSPRSVDPRQCAEAKRFLARLDSVGLVVLNGLVALGEQAEPTRLATATANSAVDYIMVNAEHWTMADQVTVDENAAAEIKSDHLLIRSVLHLPHPNGAPTGEASTAARWPDSVEFAVSGRRYRVDSKGNPRYFDAYAEKCALLLEPLLQEWNSADVEREAAGGDGVDGCAAVGAQIECRWAQFRQVISEAAQATLGYKESRRVGGGSGGGHAVYRPQDANLRLWKRQRRALRESRQQVKADDQEEIVRINEQLRQLDGRIKKHVQKAVREQRQREVEKAVELAPHRARDHWSALAALAGPPPKVITVPSVVVDAAGEVSSGVEATRRGWLAFWSDLAKEPPPDDPRFDARAEERVTESLRREQDEAAAGPSDGQRADAAGLNVPITLKEITASVSRLRNAKSPGCDDIMGEMLKHGGDAMDRALLSMCRSAFTSGQVPLDWMRGVVVPIHKDGDTRDPANYRPITLLSIVAKVYTGVLHHRLLLWSEANGIVVQEQAGFRPDRGCAEQLFTLTELVKLRRLCGHRTYTAFLDIRKAYDTVWHDGLKLRLLEAGVRGEMYAAICSLYSACASCLRLGGEAGYTEFFSIEAGVRQGCILSPLLYSIFINGLAVAVKRLGIGATIQGDPWLQRRQVLTILLYADDIVLLADSQVDLQQLLTCVGEYSQQWSFEFNHAKSGGVRFNRSGKQCSTTPLTLAGRSIPWVTCYRYLGVELTNYPFRAFRQRMIGSASRAAGQLAAMGLYSGKLPVPLGVRVYQALVRPLLEYAAEVTSVRAWDEAEKLQANVAKRILQCPRACSNTAVLGELGWITMAGRWQKLRLGFWGRLLSMTAESNRPARQVYDATVAYFHAHAHSVEGQPAAGTRAEGWSVSHATKGANTIETLWCAQIQRDLYSLALSSLWARPDVVAQIGPQAWKNKSQRMVLERESACWWNRVQGRPQLQRFYATVRRQAHDESPLLARSAYLDIRHRGWADRVRVGRCALTLLRVEAHRLRVRTASWEKAQGGLHPLIDDCRMCADGREDEEHFLLRCTYYTDRRHVLYQQINAIVRDAEAKAPQPSPGAPARPSFDMTTEPAATQLQVMAGEAYGVPRLVTCQAAVAVTRMVLIAVGSWMAEFESHLKRLDDIAEAESPTSEGDDEAETHGRRHAKGVVDNLDAPGHTPYPY